MELLVVLAILGLLAAISAPQMQRYFAHGQTNAAETELARLSASLHLFRADVGRYPSTAEGLSALFKRPASLENWNGPYVRTEAAFRDPWGNPFFYRSPGQTGAFDLSTQGPGGHRNEQEARR